MKLFVYLLLLVTLCFNVILSQRVVYVNVKSGCFSSCGSKQSPFSNIQDAIEYLEISAGPNLFNPSDQVDQIIVAPGIYSGSKNTNLKIIKPLQIISNELEYGEEFPKLVVPKQFIYNSKQPIIQCNGISNAISVLNTDLVKIVNIGIHNCVGVKGAGVYIENASLELIRVLFYKNTAERGGAIYAKNSRVNSIESSLVENFARDVGSVIYSADSTIIFIGKHQVPCPSSIFPPLITSQSNSVKLVNSMMTFDEKTDASINIDCDSNSLFTSGGISLCPYTTVNCRLLNSKVFTYDLFDPKPVTCNEDGVCNDDEDCLQCPSECSCQFSGWKLSVLYDLGDSTNVDYFENLSQRSISNAENMIGDYRFKNNYLYNIYAKFEGYNNVPVDGKYKFKIYGKNIGITMFVNDALYIQSPLTLGEYNVSKEISLSSAIPISFKIIINQNYPPIEMDIKVFWKNENDNEFKLFKPFYSYNVCGDKIIDPLEGMYPVARFLCPSDSIATSRICGDGICNEHPDDCFIDCYNQFTDTCPEQAPSYPLDKIYEKNDFLGSIISNQYLFSLPGIQLLSHGIDIVTEKFVNSPIFHFGYCDNSSFSTIHDLYRGLVYSIPKGVYAIPVPKCSYQSQSNSFKTSSQMASQLTLQTGLSAAVDLEGGFWGYSFGAKVAFSQEESVKTASELEQTLSGEIFETKVECETTRIHLDPKLIKFHKNFLADIAKASTIESMKQLIKKYGNVYVKSAVMGGKLVSLTIVDHVMVSGQSSFDISKHTDLSFSMQVSSPILNVDGEAQVGIDNKISNDQLRTFQADSKTSTIKTYGGGLGAYGPDSFGKNNFGQWAKQVDLSPIPLRKQYGFIYDIIPSTWVTNTNPKISIQKLWYEAETLNMYQALAGRDLKLDETIYYLNFPVVSETQEYSGVSIIGNRFVGGQPESILQNIEIVKNKEPFIATLMEVNIIGMIPVTEYGYELIDLVNSRVYYFGYDNVNNYPRNSYTIRLDKVNIIKCSANLDCTTIPKVLVILRGKLGKLEFLINDFSTTAPNSFTYQGKYIGELESITLQLKVKFENSLSTINAYEIPNLSVVQTCPNEAGDYGDNGKSKCTTPKNIPINSPYSILYSQMVKTPSYLSYNKPITRTLTNKRLPPLPQIL